MGNTPDAGVLSSHLRFPRQLRYQVGPQAGAPALIRGNGAASGIAHGGHHESKPR